MLPPDNRGPAAWVLAGGPGARGAEAALSGVHGADACLLLVGTGLAWLGTSEALALLRRTGADLALCSQSARERGLDAATTPAGVRWSSVATWMAELGDRPFGWLAP